jgi:hypothetical protein
VLDADATAPSATFLAPLIVPIVCVSVALVDGRLIESPL